MCLTFYFFVLSLDSPRRADRTAVAAAAFVDVVVVLVVPVPVAVVVVPFIIYFIIDELVCSMSAVASHRVTV